MCSCAIAAGKAESEVLVRWLSDQSSFQMNVQLFNNIQVQLKSTPSCTTSPQEVTSACWPSPGSNFTWGLVADFWSEKTAGSMRLLINVFMFIGANKEEMDWPCTQATCCVTGSCCSVIDTSVTVCVCLSLGSGLTWFQCVRTLDVHIKSSECSD